MKYTYYPHSPDTLRHVRPARSALKTYFDTRSSPFLRYNWYSPFNRFLSLLFSSLERCLNTTLYFENTERELALFSTPTKRLLRVLFEQGKIEGWEVNKMSHYYPPIQLCKIKPASVFLPDNTRVQDSSMISSGVGTDLDAAMKVALAECLERDAASMLDETKCIRAVYADITHTAIEPQTFSFGVAQELVGNVHQNEMGWVSARSLPRGNKVLIPAQLGYIFYHHAFRGDPWLHSATSNGVAAYTSKRGARMRAFYELIERDAFLKYWLTKTTPRKIKLESIDVPDQSTFLKSLEKYGLEIHVLDCQTEFNIPVLVMVLIDRERSSLVRVSAEAGFDITSMIKKLRHEILKWLHFIPTSVTGFTWGKHGSTIRTLSDRGSFWTQPAMVREIDFLISGKAITYQTYCSEVRTHATPRTPSDIRFFLEHFNLEGYEIDHTTALSKRNGLYVFRYIIPELLPLYFQEEKKPINMDRLAYFHKNMRISDKVLHETDLNSTPHPFL